MARLISNGRCCGTIGRVTRWVCPNCEREFASVNQAHICVPGITVSDLLNRHPRWVTEIYAAVIEHLRILGPVHEDAVNAGSSLRAIARSRSSGRAYGPCRSVSISPTSYAMLGSPGSYPLPLIGSFT